MQAPVISAMGHVALRVRDLDDALQVATTIMGLRESGRDGEWVNLTSNASHHELQLAAGEEDRVDHIGFEANGPEALAEIRSRLEREEVPLLSDRPLDASLASGVSFLAPSGFTFEVYTGMPHEEPPFAPTGVRPKRFGHVNMHCLDAPEMIGFLERVLDFRVSDYVGPGAFLRCNAEHHGAGVGQREVAHMHHIAWEVESIADLGHLGDVLDDHGRHLLWGPVRHGVGRNIAAYFEAFGGLMIEYYCDMLRIWDEATFVPGRWDTGDPRFLSVWSRHDLIGFREHGLRPVERPGGPRPARAGDVSDVGSP